MSEKTVTYIVIAFIGIFLIFCLCGEEVRNNGNGADTVRNELRQAGIYNVEESRIIGELEKENRELGEANRAIEASEQESLTLIRECKQILRTVRERGEAQAANP